MKTIALIVVLAACLSACSLATSKPSCAALKREATVGAGVLELCAKTPGCQIRPEDILRVVKATERAKSCTD